MPRLTTTIDIHRPAAEVFDFVADHTNAPRWQRGLAEVRRLTDAPIGVGTEHLFVRRFAGRRLESINRFTMYLPGRFVEFEFPRGWLTGQASYGVEPLGPSRCRLTSTIAFRLRSFGWLLEPPMARLMAADSRRDELALRRLLEATPPPGAGAPPVVVEPVGGRARAPHPDVERRRT